MNKEQYERAFGKPAEREAVISEDAAEEGDDEDAPAASLFKGTDTLTAEERTGFVIGEFQPQIFYNDGNKVSTCPTSLQAQPFIHPLLW